MSNVDWPTKLLETRLRSAILQKACGKVYLFLCNTFGCKFWYVTLCTAVWTVDAEAGTGGSLFKTGAHGHPACALQISLRDLGVLGGEEGGANPCGLTVPQGAPGQLSPNHIDPVTCGIQLLHHDT